jgi:molybdate transport system substrate-binding protein
MVGYALGDLVKQGKIIADSRVDLVKSPIGIAVKSGATKPDISSADAVRHALLAAKSIAYSDSASGVYVSTEMFQRLGITEDMKGKARQIPAEPVAGVVARGDAEIGLQQISEMLPVAGVDIVGPLPADLQKITVFSAGIATGSREPDAGRAGQVSGVTCSPRRDRQERHGADPDELAGSCSLTWSGPACPSGRYDRRPCAACRSTRRPS